MDRCIEPADIHTDEKVVWLAATDALRRRIEPDDQRILAIDQKRSDIVSQFGEHAFVLAQLLPVQPDSARIADAAEDESFAITFFGTLKCLFQPPGFVALGAGAFIVAADIGIRYPARVEQRGLYAARHKGGNGIAPRAVQPLACRTAFRHLPALIKWKTQRSRWMLQTAGAQFYRSR